MKAYLDRQHPAVKMFTDSVKYTVMEFPLEVDI